MYLCPEGTARKKGNYCGSTFRLLVMIDNLTSHHWDQKDNIPLAIFHLDLACDGAWKLTNRLTNFVRYISCRLTKIPRSRPVIVD